MGRGIRDSEQAHFREAEVIDEIGPINIMATACSAAMLLTGKILRLQVRRQAPA